MKIWVIGRGYPTPANKMWGSFELEQAKLLARHGHKVSYLALTLSFFNRKDPRGMRVFEEDGVTVIAYSHIYFPGKLGIYWERYEDSCWRRLFAEAEKQGVPDLIHIHYPSMISSINEINAYKKRGIKIFVTEHWSRVLIGTLKPHELARLKYYAKNANCFASVSEMLEESVKRQIDVNVPTKIIPNIVSPVFFKNSKKRVHSDSFTFVLVGRLVPLKQFDVVIKEFLRTFEKADSAALKIIGSGSERSKLESICAGDKRIVFLGEISLQNVAREITSADVLISYSKYETFAVPVAEAWASGKPAIVSDKSGVASYVTRDMGIVVNADVDIQLGKAMRYLYDNYYSFDPNKISASAKEYFSDSAIIERLERMYTQY